MKVRACPAGTSWVPAGPLLKVSPAGKETIDAMTPRAVACPLFWTVAVTVRSWPTDAVAGAAKGLEMARAAVPTGHGPARTWKASALVPLVPYGLCKVRV